MSGQMTKDEIIALLEKTYADIRECKGGEGWLEIDGKEYYTNVGYAIEGMLIFMEVIKQRLVDKELRPVNSQPKTGYWIKTPNGFKCSRCLIVHSHTSIFCPSCGAKMIASPESEVNNG